MKKGDLIRCITYDCSFGQKPKYHFEHNDVGVYIKDSDGLFDALINGVIVEGLSYGCWRVIDEAG